MKSSSCPHLQPPSLSHTHTNIGKPSFPFLALRLAAFQALSAFSSPLTSSLRPVPAAHCCPGHSRGCLSSCRKGLELAGEAFLLLISLSRQSQSSPGSGWAQAAHVSTAAVNHCAGALLCTGILGQTWRWWWS